MNNIIPILKVKQLRLAEMSEITGFRVVHIEQELGLNLGLPNYRAHSLHNSTGIPLLNQLFGLFPPLLYSPER